MENPRIKSTRLNKREKLNEITCLEITRLYETGVSSKEIARKFNLNDTTIPKIYKKMKDKESLKPANGNERYFQFLDSHIKAYFVGFIAADGCITKSSPRHCDTLAINIHKKDRQILDTLRREIEAEKPIYNILNKNQVAFTFNSQILCDDLRQYGIDYRKSLTMPNIILLIPEQFRNSFILGYLDGDGWVSQNKSKHIYNDKIYHYVTVGFCGTKEFLQGIACELRLKSFCLREHKSIYSLSFASKSDIQSTFNYLYKDCPFYLTRKYEKWLPYVEIPSLLINQDQTISSSP